MNRRNMFDAVIVGAGIVGSSTALALSQLGLRIALVEAKPTPQWRKEDEIDPRVVALAASSVNLFSRLNGWTTIFESRVCAYRRMHVWDAPSAGELDFDAADNGDTALGYIVENSLIQHVLWQALQKCSSIDLYCPTVVTSTEITEQARVLELVDGTWLRSRLVIAADGSGSPLRQMTQITIQGHDYSQRAIVCHVETERPHGFTAWQRFLSGGPLAFLPLSDGRSSIVWSVPTIQAERLLALNDTAFAAELGVAFDFRLGAIINCTPRMSFPLKLLLAERYIAERFVLIGDAAHTVHPLAGQGVNLGLRDVSTLVEIVEHAQAGNSDFASLANLRKYERKCKSENFLAAWSFDGINRIFSSNKMPLEFLRGAAMQLINRISPVKQILSNRATGR